MFSGIALSYLFKKSYIRAIYLYPNVGENKKIKLYVKRFVLFFNTFDICNVFF